MATKRTRKTSAASAGLPAPPSGGGSQRRKHSEKITGPKARLQELIDLVKDTANAKGWTAHTAARDEKTFKYATIAVSRHAPNTYHEVTGTLEITCTDRIKITSHKTSFYSWGLDDLYDAIANEFWKLPWVKTGENKSTVDSSDVALIERLLRRFHRAARQLKHRYADRPGFHIKDEYDLQDLLHAFLRALFDDVRPEEYTPSYAGSASRMDFLLKLEKIAIEMKFASASLRDKQIGEQLMVDIQRYQAHPDCKRLICFVYDPHGNIRNPTGLESDLTQIHDKLEVKVIVISP
jgi:REase_DpnII-MboI